MIITICQKDQGFSLDIKVNRGQKIADTLAILWDGGMLPLNPHNADSRIYSSRLGEYIDTEQSFEQVSIYNGDILYMV